MLSRIVNFVGNVFQPTPTQAVRPVTTSNNPFANPFVSSSNDSPAQNTYGKNKPVMGGYFAGYYNGKPNIVGQRLFIEV